jgi:hypothetical protein
MTARFPVTVCFVLSLVCAGFVQAQPLKGSRPNIILVMTDDQPLAIRYHEQLEENGIPDWIPADIE